MKIGVPREIAAGETRVSLVPAALKDLSKLDAEILVEANAGNRAFFGNELYEKAGAKIVPDAASVYKGADLVLKVQPPTIDEVEMIREGGALVGFLSPITNKELVEKLRVKKTTAFSMELIPRITRAQSMDALSSMSTVAGYKAVLIATEHFSKFRALYFPQGKRQDLFHPRFDN